MTYAYAEEGTPFVVELSQFSGPLDLLLSLIRDERVDIYDIPISRVADQFLARISTLGLDQAADYLEMAARLLRIKAQLLLPRKDGEDAWEDPRAELVRRLLEYQQMREVVVVLERLAEDRRSRFARSYFPPSSIEAPPAPLALSLVELLSAVDRVLRVVRDPAMHDVIPRALDVDGAMATIRGVLELREHFRWRDVVRQGAERWEILSALLALLELARRGELRLAQASPFANVLIRRESTSEAA
ncbi:MAG: segregation/condensation protein A [Cytophagaceae bacterium]|nr:segregation/condensation protein A [Gemmatimonadaceae bacterium]